MTFAERLKQARLDKHLTQEQLANLIGVAKSTYNGYEKGNREPDFFKIKKIIEILEVDANYLLCIGFKKTKNAPTEQVSESEEMLLHNYKLLNNQGKKRLIEYSHDLTELPKYALLTSEEKPQHIFRAVARGGNIIEKELTDEQAKALDEFIQNTPCDYDDNI